jgi:hypothetical protein
MMLMPINGRPSAARGLKTADKKLSTVAVRKDCKAASLRAWAPTSLDSVKNL